MYVNGELEHPFGLPGVRCDICGSTWGSRRFLSYPCPDALQSEEHVVSRWPLSRDEHESLQKRVFSELGVTDGKVFVDLRPGDRFLPCYLDVPSIPRADFLWPDDGILVVSERIKDLFLALFSADISVHPVILRKIGNREARLPIPQMKFGEPEDIIKYVPILNETTDIGPYFEIIPQYESQYPPDRQPNSVCSAGGRLDVDLVDTSAGQMVRMVDEMWSGGVFSVWPLL